MQIEIPDNPVSWLADFSPTGDVWKTWSCLRSPLGISASLTERPGWLRLRGLEHGLNGESTGQPSLKHPENGTGAADVAFLGIRQRHFSVRTRVTVDYQTRHPGEEAGLAVFMSERCHYRIRVFSNNGTRQVVLAKTVLDMRSQ